MGQGSQLALEINSHACLHCLAGHQTEAQSASYQPLLLTVPGCEVFLSLNLFSIPTANWHPLKSNTL